MSARDLVVVDETFWLVFGAMMGAWCWGIAYERWRARHERRQWQAERARLHAQWRSFGRRCWEAGWRAARKRHAEVMGHRARTGG